MSDRHEKWVKVEPGTTIPAGQPYRTEATGGFEDRDGLTACEFADGSEFAFTVDGLYDGEDFTLLVDSSWCPPLNLPETPTWGILTWTARWDGNRPVAVLGKWRPAGDYVHCDSHNAPVVAVTDFIECTPEQVKRIEAAR